jgi:RNA polymerase sigma-70 factor (ECF subfamily)
VSERAVKRVGFKAHILPHEAALRRRLSALRIPDVEDVVSEVLTRAFATDNWRRMDQGRALVFQIARNLLIDAARRRAIVSIDFVADLETLQLDDGSPGPEAAVAARDELRRLQRVLDTLPAQQRRVFLMRRVQELTPQEIAGELRLSVSTVEKHLAKAMVAVTRALGAAEPVGRAGADEGRWRRTKR